MSQFSLINQLDDEHKQQIKKDPNATNITYQRYDLDIEGAEVGVLIPVRECDNFETALVGTQNLSNIKLKKIVREFRGLFSRDQ